MRATRGFSWRGMGVALVLLGRVGSPSNAHAVPISIDSVEELQLVGHDAAYPLDEDYVLTQDLDASATSSWNAGAGFDPIGDYDAVDPSVAFTGTFDGQGHSVDNLYINRPGETSVGLFGCVGGGGVVSGLRLKWSSITGSGYVGAIAGRSEGEIQDCVVKGATVSAGSYIGGVAGRNSGTLAECCAAATVTGSETFVGGLIGRNYGTIQQSCATGSVSGDDYLGGLAGANSAGGAITEAFAACRISGGLFARGGLCGSNSGTVTVSFWNKDTSLLGGTSGGGIGLSMKVMRTSAPFVDADWDFDSTWGIVEGDSYPYLVGQTVINEVSSIEDLQLVGVTSPLDGDFVLTQDLDASATAGWHGGEGFTPIGGTSELSRMFTGRFYGQGHVVTGLVINRPDEWEGVGLFRRLAGGGEIIHLGLEDCSVTGMTNVGGLVYGVSESSTVFGCHVTGSVVGDSGVSANIGGVIGVNAGMVCDSYSACSVVVNANYGGGLTGQNYGLVLRCHAAGTAEGGVLVGGLVGDNAAIVAESYATAAVSGANHAGGLAGHNDGTIAWSYASGPVTGSNIYIGGFVGRNEGRIAGCYATGAVTGEQHVGGLVGRNQDGIVDTCYSAGLVTGVSSLGGLVGTNAGSFSAVDSFWDTETSGMAVSAGGTGLTTVQMKMAASFTGWNFADVWGVDEGESYPYLLVLFPIRVTAPSGGEVWSPRSEHLITWTFAPDSGDDVKIKLFKGGVLNRWLSGGTPNDGSFFWRVPADLPLAVDYTIKIYSVSDPTKVDDSDTPFIIAEPPIEVTSPNGGESWAPSSTHLVTWDAWMGIGAEVRIKLFKGGAFNRWISGDTPNDGSYSWAVPAALALGSNYEVQIYSTTDSNYVDFSDAYFSIVEAKVKLAYPNGGDQFLPGDPVTITWSSLPGAGADVKLKLFKAGAFHSWISGGTPNDGAFAWTVPLATPTASDYTVQIYSVSDPTQVDFSNGPFSVVLDRLRITSPNGGETWRAGANCSITWDSAGTVGADVKLKLFRGGVFHSWISGGTPNDGVHTWRVPEDAVLASDYTIQIYSVTDPSIVDLSDAPFTIGEPDITLVYPNGGELLLKGSAATITWTSRPSVGANVKLKLFKGGAFHSWISGGTPNDGAFTWTVPLATPAGADYTIQIYSASDSTQVDYSDGPFSIAAGP